MAVGALGDDVAQIAGQLIQDRGLQQEILNLCRLSIENFFSEVAQNVSVTATGLPSV